MTKVKYKKILRCRNCAYVWKNNKLNQIVKCPICGKLIDARNRKEYAKDYIKKHPERLQKFKKLSKENKLKRKVNWNVEARKSAVMVIAKGYPKCVRCGCEDTRLLEINHKYGGGNKELDNGRKSRKFYNDIIKFRRETDDLEILCKVCNARHCLELKYGKLPYKIIWR